MGGCRCGYDACSTATSGSLRLSLSLWCSLLCCALDSVLRNLGRWVLLRQQVQVLFGDSELTMRGCNISVLNVLRVQRLQLPVSVLLLLGILEVGDLAEHCDLLNEVLQRAGVD